VGIGLRIPVGTGAAGNGAEFLSATAERPAGGQLPAPAELAPEVSSDVRSTLRQMHLWIHVLDMAITPAMLRLGVQSDA